VKIDVGEYTLPKILGNNFALLPNDESQVLLVDHIKSLFDCLDQVKSSDDINNYYCEDSELSLTIPANYRDPTMTKYLAICKRRKTTPGNQHRSRGGYHNNHSNKPAPQKYYFGKEEIVKTLRNLPRTKHILDSFVCDVTLCTSELIRYIISGTFEEVGMNEKVRLRSFTRSIFCGISTIPKIRFIILSDMLHIRNPTIAEKKENAARASATQLPQQPAVSDDRNEMVKKFMQDSRMNQKYSQECLEINGWDYVKAGRNFMELQQKGSIPAEAFQA